jgi:hypothetical protein
MRKSRLTSDHQKSNTAVVEQPKELQMVLIQQS